MYGTRMSSQLLLPMHQSSSDTAGPQDHVPTYPTHKNVDTWSQNPARIGFDAEFSKTL